MRGPPIKALSSVVALPCFPQGDAAGAADQHQTTDAPPEQDPPGGADPPASNTGEGLPAPAPEGAAAQEEAAQQQEPQVDTAALQQQAAAQVAAALATAQPAQPAAAAQLAGQQTVNPDGTVSEIMMVPKGQVGKLIGRGGSTISSLQNSSGCSIQVDHNTPGDQRAVTLKGTADAVRSARAGITAVLEGAEAGAGGEQGEITETISCPHSIVGRIIGRGGETIRSLQQASGAHILVNQDFPEGTDRQVSITGRADGVQRAIAMIRELMSGEPGTASSIISRVAQQLGIGTTRGISCPRAVVGRVIGKGGDTIKGLQRKYNASIQIDQSKDPMNITITAPPAMVAACESEIRAIMNDEMYGGGMGGGPMGGPGGYGGPGGMGPGGYGGGFGGPGMGRGGFGGPGPYGGGPYGPGPGAYGGYGGYPAAPAAYGGYGGGYGGYGAGAAPAAYGGYGAPAGGYGAGGYGAGAAGGAAGGGAAGPAAGGGAGGGGGSVWQALQDDQNRTYYYNTTTGQSQWEKPAEMP